MRCMGLSRNFDGGKGRGKILFIGSDGKNCYPKYMGGWVSEILRFLMT